MFRLVNYDIRRAKTDITSNRYMPVVIMPTLSFGLLSGIQNEKPVQKRHNARKGNVTRSKFLLPKVSMVKNAGSAKTQFRMPVPIEAKRADEVEYPEAVKMVVL